MKIGKELQDNIENQQKEYGENEHYKKYNSIFERQDSLRIDEDIPPIRAFVDLVINNFPDKGTILEVGVWQGETSCYYLPFIKEKGGQSILIDWFIGNKEHISPTAHGFGFFHREKIEDNLRFNVDFLQCSDFTKVISKMSKDAAEDILDDSVDIGFIDASHTYENVLQDLNLYYPKIKSGGILSGHDYDQYDIKRAVENFTNRYDLSCESVPDDNGQRHPIFVIRKP